ncbi:archaellin/type IV pilin N-terminal domain-containing protein [Methanoregula sp.]|uniref:archaellin/type IV pilin N-terminal domain-containing protein n=1 Tax=Methanoregula sp. TaxID=2052170 RepID=UPI0035680C00
MKKPVQDSAFTGLEAAVVLIAFVVVAAVFSYVVLNTGFFVTQKSQEVIYSAVNQADSVLGPIGGVYGVTDPVSGQLVKINFSCRVAFGTTKVDFGRVTVVYTNATVFETLQMDPDTYNPAGCQANSGTWAVYERINSPAPDNQLTSGAEFMISACPSQPPVNDDTIHLEIRPADGVALDITRSVSNLAGTVHRLH